MKFVRSDVFGSHTFDELLLALYTPRGFYVYRHDFAFHITSNGRNTASSGYQIQISGPRHEQDWTRSLDFILGKPDGSPCARIAVVMFDD